MPARIYDHEAAFAFAVEHVTASPELTMRQLHKLAIEADVAKGASFGWWCKMIARARRHAGVSGGAEAERAVSSGKVRVTRYETLSREDKAAWNYRGAKRLAQAVIAEAWAEAGKRPSTTKDNSVAAPALRIKWARIWLQSPHVTALWCGMADVDPEALAELSLSRHGRPRLTATERAALLYGDTEP